MQEQGRHPGGGSNNGEAWGVSEVTRQRGGRGVQARQEHKPGLQGAEGGTQGLSGRAESPKGPWAWPKSLRLCPGALGTQ